MIPIARPDLGQEEIDAVAEVIRSGIIAQGPRVRELEAAWADYCGVRQTIAVGETYDFEVQTPPGRQTLWLDVKTTGGKWQVQGQVIVR